MKQFTLNRFGVVHTYHSKSTNQCKSPGWTDYRYHVKVTATTKLDDKGFVVDHKEIQKVCEKVFETANSCENICIALENSLKLMLDSHGVELKKLYIKVHPLMQGYSEDYAFMEYEADYSTSF